MSLTGPLLQGVFTVFAKETLDNLRDRRSLGLAFLYPLLGPVLLGVLMSVLGGLTSIDPRTDIELAVFNPESAPALIAHFEAQGIRVIPVRENPAQAVRSGRQAAVIAVPEDFTARLASDEGASVDILSDSSRLSSLLASSRAIEAVAAFSSEESGRRLKSHGLTRAAAQPVEARSVNLASRSDLGDLFLYMIPPFLMFSIFIGGVYLAIDSTAGERERGSLEPLLANPLPRGGFMMGKYLAALFYTVLAVLVQVAAFKAMFILVGDVAGAEKRLPFSAMGAIVLVALPLAMLAVAIQVIIATVSKSFKEAQTYLGLLPLVPAIPGLALIFLPLQPEAWMMTLPTFGQTLLFGLILRGEPLDVWHVAIAAISTLLLTGLLLKLAAKLYAREDLIFGS
jgi:sodium transport system permease protein